MSHELFHPDDIFTNRVKAHPEYNVIIYNSDIIVNGHRNLVDSSGNPVLNVSKGHISLFEMNINRRESSPAAFHRPFITQSQGANYKHTFRKDINALVDKKTILTNTSDCNLMPLAAPPADVIYGQEEYSAGITRTLALAATSRTVPDIENNCVGTVTLDWHPDGTAVNVTASALQNLARKYVHLSKHFVFVGSGLNTPLYTYGGASIDGDAFVGGVGEYGTDAGNSYLKRDLTTSTVNMINIPSIFYGSTIKKGTVKLQFYVTGTLLAECKDENENGELIGTYGETSGSVVGICMYDEGIMLLTSSVDLELDPSAPANAIKYEGSAGSAKNASWIYYGVTCNDGVSDATLADVSYNLDFEGTTYTSTMTLFCHSKKGQHNHSNNPTFIDIVASSGSQGMYVSSSQQFIEYENSIKNIVSSSFKNAEEKMKKTTYLSTIGIYDNRDNLIATAQLARPIKKTEEDDYTFKLTLDI